MPAMSDPAGIVTIVGSVGVIRACAGMTDDRRRELHLAQLKSRGAAEWSCR